MPTEGTGKQGKLNAKMKESMVIVHKIAKARLLSNSA